MKLPRIFVAAMILMLAVLAAGGAPARAYKVGPSLPTQTAPPGPVVARVYYPDRLALEKLGPILDTWEVRPDQGYLVALLTPQEYQTLLSQGYRVEVDAGKTALVNQPRQPLKNQVNGIPGFPCYRTVEETYASLSSLAANHSSLASWQDIGDSWEKAIPGGLPGYDLHVLVLTNHAIPGPKPKFFLMAEIHAREYTTAETAARFADHLVNNYGVDPDVTWLLDYTEVHIVAMSNPDGRKLAEAGSLWRKNTDSDDGCLASDSWGVDLNRNSSFHWGGDGASKEACHETYRGPSAGSEPEVQAIQSYVAGIFPDQRGPGVTDAAPLTATGTFITLHSYGRLVLWPWGDTPLAAPNAPQLRTLGRKFAYFNHYAPIQSNVLYPTSGATDDWAYGELGLAAYTFEMGTDFFQGCGYFENTLYPDNLQALLYAAKSTHQPYTIPSGPDALALAAGPFILATGEPLTLTATLDDTRYSGGEPTQNIAQAVVYLDAPPWVSTAPVTYAMAAVDGAFDEKIEAAQAAIDSTGLSAGRHTLLVRGRDANGSWGPMSAAFVYVLDPEASPRIEGYVRAASDNAPLPAMVTAGPFQTVADPATGYYNMMTISGTYDLSASLDLYNTSTAPRVRAEDHQTIRQDFLLYPICGNEGGTTGSTVPTEMRAITSLALSQAITGTVRSGGAACLSADLAPDDATKPYTYTIDYGDGAQVITASSSADPLPLAHIFAAPGDYTVQMAAWNEVMTQPVTASLQVTALPPLIPISQVDLSVAAAGTPRAGDEVAFTADILPNEADKPYTYTVAFGDDSASVTATASADPLPLAHLYAAPGEYTVTITAWNAALTQPASGTATVILIEAEPKRIYMPFVQK